ncbi:replicative helicase loader/inhibitor [Cytobacillus sp. NJ13]|nr:replicative helicase loader/inhibitor [Cytobacillus sp. NJ13]
MTKRETYTLLALISVYYNQFEVNQQKIDYWHEVLKHHEIEDLRLNLLRHVEVSPYPPKISDLVRKSAAVSRAIPDCRDTAFIVPIPWKPASEEVVQAELAKMREILGIARGEA